MKRVFRARWTNVHEKSHDNQHNGVLEEITNETKFVCFISPVALAYRIAHALNVTASFSDAELAQMAKALETINQQ